MNGFVRSNSFIVTIFIIVSFTTASFSRNGRVNITMTTPGSTPYCHPACTCTGGDWAAWECENGDFITERTIAGVLKTAPKTLYRFSFKGNNLKTFPVEYLQSFTHLEELDLSNNSFVHIPDDISLYARPLYTLNLSYNKISSLSKARTGAMYNLKRLHLTGNSLTAIEDDVFWNCSTLYGLYLQDNEIVKISSKSFNGLKRLSFLDLSRNKIRHLEVGVFKPLRLLGNLLMSDNQLRVIPSLTLKNLNPRRVSFARNNIIEIKVMAFYEVVFESLDLSWNMLTTFPLKSLRVSSSIFETLYLIGNPIVCDCALHEAYQKIVVDAVVHGTCVLPANSTNHTIKHAMNQITCTPCWNVKCPPGKVCQYDKQNYTRCVCERMKVCELDPCYDSACQNGATCVRVGRYDFNCVCPEGYTGVLCSGKITIPSTTTITTTIAKNGTPYKKQTTTISNHYLGVGWTVFIVFASIAALIVIVASIVLAYRKYYGYLSPTRQLLDDNDISLQSE